MIWDAIKARLGEGSTWKGLLSVATGIGLQLNGQQIDAIAAAMVAIRSCCRISSANERSTSRGG
jgi:hypothetical protein